MQKKGERGYSKERAAEKKCRRKKRVEAGKKEEPKRSADAKGVRIEVRR